VEVTEGGKREMLCGGSKAEKLQERHTENLTSREQRPAILVRGEKPEGEKGRGTVREQG